MGASQQHGPRSIFKHRRDSIASIVDLPPEILLQIFHLLPLEDPIPVPWDFFQSPTTVLHVCSSWRQCAIHDPGFWCNIIVALNVQRTHFMEMFQETLLRSRRRRLSIHIRGDQIPLWIEDFFNIMLPAWERVISFNVIWREQSLPIPTELRCFYEDLHPKFPLRPYLGRLTELVIDGVPLRPQPLFHLLRNTNSLQKLVYKPTMEFKEDALDPVQLLSFQPMTDVRLPHLTHLSMRSYEWNFRTASALGFIVAPALTHLALIGLDDFEGRRQKWVPGLEHAIAQFNLISLRVDLEISTETASMIMGSCIKLRELILPCIELHGGLMRTALFDLIRLLKLTHLVFNCGSNFKQFLKLLEGQALRTALKKHTLKDVFVIWDTEDEEDFGSVEDMIERVERLNEGGIRVKLSTWKNVDFEVDLAQLM